MALKYLEKLGGLSRTYKALKSNLSRTPLILTTFANVCYLMNVIWTV
jgi:hypothetical protein